MTAKLKTMGELFMGRCPEREINLPCVHVCSRGTNHHFEVSRI